MMLVEPSLDDQRKWKKRFMYRKIVDAEMVSPAGNLQQR